MPKFSVVALEDRPITMNESASATEACNQMRDCRAGSVLVMGKLTGWREFLPVAMRCRRVLALRRDPSIIRLAEVTTRDPQRRRLTARRSMRRA